MATGTDIQPSIKAFWEISQLWQARFMERLSAEIRAQRDHVTLWLPVIFSCGIAFYFSLLFEPPAILVAAFGCVVAALLLVARDLPAPRLVLMGVLIAWAGFACGQARTFLVEAPVLTEEIDITTVEGTIQSLVLLDEGRGSRIVLGDVTIEDLPPDRTPHLVRMNIAQDEGLRAGQRVRVLGGLNPPSPPVSPESFDFQRYMYFNRIGAQGFAFKPPEILIARQNGSFLNNALEQYRQDLAQKAKSHIPDPAASVAIALLTGERAAMPQDVWENIRAAGLAHIIAISGMNIGMVAGAMFFIARFLMALFPRFALYHPIKKYAAFLAFMAAVMYALIVGLTVPTQRALIMTGMFLLAVVVDRSPFSLRMVALSALALLILFPEILLGASFQMSFAAVISLIWFYDSNRIAWGNLFKNAGWMKRSLIYFSGICITTILATIATAPFSLFHFQQLPVYGVLGNFLVVPLVGFWIMPAAIIIYITAPLGLAEWPLWLMGQGVEAILWIAAEVAAMPQAVFHFRAMPGAALSLMTVGMLWLFLWRGRWKILGILPLLAAMLVIVKVPPPDVLASATGKLVMARLAPDRLDLSSLKSDRFTAETWVQEAGLPAGSIAKWPAEGVLETDRGTLTCAAEGCRLVMKGVKIAISYQEWTLPEDCIWADIVITENYIRQPCENARVMDGKWLRANGAAAVLVGAGNVVSVKTVTSERGDRPWASSNAR